MTNCHRAQAQNRPFDGQAVAMLKEFYTGYITESSKPPTLESLKKMDALARKYCTAALFNKFEAQKDHGYLDADPYIHAQDVDISWLKTMSFKKVARKQNEYILSYTNIPPTYKQIIYLTLVKQGGNYKISAIK